MSDVKISQLPAATTPLAGTELVPLVQGGVTKQVAVSSLGGGTVTAVTATSPVASSGGTTPNISMPAASGSTSGYLTSTDWTTFNNKGTVTGVTATSPVVSSGGTAPVISMPAASGSTSGYLTSTDWTTFNNKQPAGSYLTNGGALGTPSSGTATNLTGLPLSTGVTGILPVANGGTGTATPGLVAGTNVTITGTWPNQTINSSGGGGGMVYPGAGIPNSTGSAWGTSYSTTGSGTVVALANSPSFTTPILGTPQSGNFSTGTFTWPTFNQNTTGTASNVTGTVAIANGGTGQTTAAAAITALTGTQVAGRYLRSDGTNASLSAIQAGDVPTLNQNTTGTAANITATSNSTLTTLSALSLPGSQVSGNISGNAANVTGTVAIANGGTGQTTAAAAITALAGTQVSGQYLRSNGTNTLLSAIQAADVPTLNQNTTGTAANITATSNSTLITLSALSLPGSQVSGNISGNAANVTGVVAAANGGTGLTSVGTSGNVLTSNGTAWISSALPAGVSLSANNTWTGTQTFNGTSSIFGASLLDTNEAVNVVGSAPASTTNFYIQSGSVQYYTSNAANNWTLNIAFSSGTSLNTALATGQSVTFTLITTQGSTAYYANAITIDGTSVTPKWIGGAPTAGNASGLDVYRFAVVKTASATYTVLASLTQFK